MSRLPILVLALLAAVGDGVAAGTQEHLLPRPAAAALHALAGVPGNLGHDYYVITSLKRRIKS